MRGFHNSDGFWLKEFDHIRYNSYVSKQYLTATSFIVYSISVSTDSNNNLKISLPNNLELNENGMYDLYYGQHFSPQRNLDLFKKFHIDFDLSINNFDKYDSRDLESTKIFNLFKPDSISDFIFRIGLSNVRPNDDLTIPLENFYTLYLGYNRVYNYKYKGDLIEDHYEGTSSTILSELDPSCFKWIMIDENGHYAEELTKEELKSSTLVLDFKISLDINKIISWIEDNFTDKIDNLKEAFNSSKLDFNFIFYPPSITGMQLIDVPTILHPSGILKTKVVTEVMFEISKSLIDNSQKMFEISFVDKDNPSYVIFKDDSVINPEAFKISSKKGDVELYTLPLENSIFEDIGRFDYPVDNFIIIYTIPKEVVKYLANNLNYTIKIKTSDLTSERR